MEHCSSCLLSPKVAGFTGFLACLQENVQSWPAPDVIRCAIVWPISGLYTYHPFQFDSPPNGHAMIHSHRFIRSYQLGGACAKKSVRESQASIGTAGSVSNNMHFRCMHRIAASGSEAELDSESQLADIVIPDYCSGCGVKLQDHDPDFPG